MFLAAVSNNSALRKLKWVNKKGNGICRDLRHAALKKPYYICNQSLKEHCGNDNSKENR